MGKEERALYKFGMGPRRHNPALIWTWNQSSWTSRKIEPTYIISCIKPLVLCLCQSACLRLPRFMSVLVFLGRSASVNPSTILFKSQSVPNSNCKLHSTTTVRETNKNKAAQHAYSSRFEDQTQLSVCMAGSVSVGRDSDPPESQSLLYFSITQDEC